MPDRRDWLNAREAVARLDVKPATLYSYVSRGLLQSVPSRAARGRMYARSDVERLKARHDARKGHAAVAAGALRWGEPTLETQISDIRVDGPYYRGVSALSLLASARSFECAAELVWTGALPEQVRWPRARPSVRPRAASKRDIANMAAQVAQLALVYARGSAREPNQDRRRSRETAAELAKARTLLSALAAADEHTPRAIASGLARSLGSRPSDTTIERLDRALILCIDHELNASTFTARVAASAGAELFACVAAGLHTLSGSAHGGVSARVEALIDEVVQAKSATRVVRSYLARGAYVPGFGHPLYPHGDPRCSALLALSEGLSARSAELSALHALIAAMQREAQLAPNLDTGLVALCRALRLRRGSASLVFAIGRIAGFVAHVLEQRAQGYLLRPRARYVGV